MQSWMDTSRTWHRKKWCRKKEVSCWSDWNADLLSWSQNQVQIKRFLVSVCSKHGILLTRDLFEAKPCDHVAVPWHHPPNPCKPMQNLPPSKAPQVSWYQPWQLDIPLKFEWSLFLTSQYALMVSIDLEIQSNISVFVTNPYKSLNPVQLHQQVDFNFPPWPVRSHSMHSWELRCWPRPECEIYTWTNKEGRLSYQATFVRAVVETENGISSTIHSSAVIKPVEQHLDRLWTSDSLLQTISIFFWMPQRCEGVIKLSVEIKLCQISTKAPETPRPRLVENPWKPTVYLSLLKGLSFYIHKLQGFPSRMQSDLSDWFENLWSFFGTGIQDCNLNIKQWKNQSRRTCVQWCGFLNEVSTMRKWLNLTILTIHEAPCSHMASSKLPSR